MRNDFINPHGVQTSINNTGILLCYSLDNKNSVEIFFNSLKTALKHFEVKSVNEITGIDILSNDY